VVHPKGLVRNLLVEHHGPEHDVLVNRFPLAERARGFLVAKDLDPDDLDGSIDQLVEFNRRSAKTHSGIYRDLAVQGMKVRVGMEASGHARWFERLLAEVGFEVWIGDPAEIQAARVKKQKTDRKDAQLLLKLMMEDRFPRTWVPSPENRDLRQLLWHRHRLVQMRTRIMNQLQALAISGKSAAAIAAELKRAEISVRSRASKLRVLLGTRKAKGK